MSSRLIRVAVFLAVVILVAVSCDDTCPPFEGPESAKSPTDQSSIEVPKGASPTYNGDVWCASPKLEISSVDLKALVQLNGCFVNRADTAYPCDPESGLGAVDIEPTNLTMTKAPKGILKYDLDSNKPRNEATQTFTVYQLKDPIPPAPTLAWRYAGTAVRDGKFAKSSKIWHFSVFALVEPPAPVELAGSGPGDFIILSDFVDDGNGILSVQVEIVGSTVGEPEQIRVIAWTAPDPSGDVGAASERCAGLDELDAQLSCLFPIDSRVFMEFAERSTVIEGDYAVEIIGSVEMF